jgi:hypothetical protein
MFMELCIYTPLLICLFPGKWLSGVDVVQLVDGDLDFQAGVQARSASEEQPQRTCIYIYICVCVCVCVCVC